jgi:hypothetical protein
MSEARAYPKVKSATIEAVIIRADGRREPLGIIGEYRAGPMHAVARFLKDLIRRIVP